MEAMDSLVEIGPDAYGPLLNAFKEFDDPGLRSFIPEALAEKWGQAAFPHLIELLDDLQNGVRLHAAVALGKLRDKRAVEALMRHLNDPDADVREAVADALKNLGVKSTPASQPAGHA